jgi:2-dehydropantoate 2-reductase
MLLEWTASRSQWKVVMSAIASASSALHSLPDATPARICVAGSGAIGGTLAARLALAGHDVGVIARGAQLDAIRRSGLRLIDSGGSVRSERIADVKAAAQPDFGVQDIVFVAVKAHGLKDMLPLLAPMIGADTMVIPTINGVPWWYFQGEAGRFDGEAVQAVDPGGALLRMLPWQHVIGCAVYIAAHVVEPGVIVTTNANRLILGEPTHRHSPRLAALCRRLEQAGVRAEATDRIRDAIWVKLMANLATNPLSVVTEASLGQIHDDDGLRAIVRTIMQEALLVGRSYGAQPDVDIDQLLAQGRKLGAFKTSMLQDFEKGQPLELAAIGDAVVELAARSNIAIPATQQMLALARYRSLHTRPHS